MNKHSTCSCRKKNERGVGDRGAGMEQGAGVTEIGWSAEWLFLLLTVRSHTLLVTVVGCLSALSVMYICGGFTNLCERFLSYS